MAGHYNPNEARGKGGKWTSGAPAVHANVSGPSAVSKLSPEARARLASKIVRAPRAASSGNSAVSKLSPEARARLARQTFRSGGK